MFSRINRKTSQKFVFHLAIYSAFVNYFATLGFGGTVLIGFGGAVFAAIPCGVAWLWLHRHRRYRWQEFSSNILAVGICIVGLALVLSNALVEPNPATAGQAVKFEIDTELEQLTTCDCSICRRKNALMVKVHESSMRILCSDDALTTYVFNTQTAQHFFCKICGIYPFHRKRVTPDYFGVNVFCLEGFDLSDIPVCATDGKGMS